MAPKPSVFLKIASTPTTAINKTKREYFISINIIEMANNANYNRLIRETAAEAARQAQANENAQMAAALAASTVNENRRANRQFAANIAATVIVAKAEGAAGAKADILNLMRTGGAGGKHLAPAKREILLRVAAVDDVMISLHPMDQGLKNSLFGLLNALLKGIDGTLAEADLVEALQVADGEVIYNPEFNAGQGHLAEGAIFRDIAAAHEELKVQDKAAEEAAAAKLQKLIQEHAAQMARDAETAKRLEDEKKARNNAARRQRYGAPAPIVAPVAAPMGLNSGTPPGGPPVVPMAAPVAAPVAAPIAAPIAAANNFGAMLPSAAPRAGPAAAAPAQQPNAAERRRRMAEAAAARMKGGRTRRRKLRSGSRKRLNVHRRDRR